MSTDASPASTSHAPGAAPAAGRHALADALVADALVADALAGLEQLKALAERAVAQVDDRAIAVALGDEANSIAVLLRHVAGNLRSRWTDFLDTDGEKPDRDRDGEFEARAADADRARLLADWDVAWGICLASIGALGADDLQRTVTIRGEPVSVVAAIGRTQRHVAQHVGQIVLLAKHLAGDRWETLSIPRRR